MAVRRALGHGDPDEPAAPARRSRRSRYRRFLGSAAAAAVVASGLAACGSGAGSGTPTLTWYINPDDGGQATIAQRCTKAAEGRYQLTVSQLPRDAGAQREQLVRRLAANDSSIDLMSLDPIYVPELAQAKFLAPVPSDVAQRVSQGVVQSSIDSATWNGRLVTVPFWANTQLLWYRKSVAQAAGLDMTKPVTWDQLVQAAKSQHKLVSAQGKLAESLTVWLNALIESAGGSIIAHNSSNPDNIKLGLESTAGLRAGQVMRQVATSGAVGPAFSTEDENASATEFQSADGGFMVNWPFVWPLATSAVKAGTLKASVPADYGWALYPRTDADKPSAPPFGGINLGIGAFSKHAGLAYQAAECITSDANQAYYFATNGNPASSTAVYDDPAVLKAFPQAPVIRDSLEAAAPRPQTAYYSEVSGGIQTEYHPPASVGPATARRATDLITAVLQGKQLL
jgi:multiple sugar transport system substrate-binding protein